MLEKTEPYKKLENRVIEEIISHINLDDVKISESQFDRRENIHSNSDQEIQHRHPKRGQESDCDLRKRRTTFEKSTFKPQNQEDSLHPDMSYHSDNIKEGHSGKIEEEKQNSSSPQKSLNGRNIDPDFLELKETVDQDITEWSRICQNKSVIVYK